MERRTFTHTALIGFLALGSVLPCRLHARQDVTYLDCVSSTNTAAKTASYVYLEDIKPTGKWRIMVDFSVGNATKTMAIFSCKYRFSGGTWKRLNLYNIAGTYRLDMLADNGTGLQHMTEAKAVSGFRQTFVYDAGQLYLDGALLADASSENGLLTSENCEPIAIFGDPAKLDASFNNTGLGSLYRVRMWDETGAEVCDLRPCLDADGVAALYDAVNDTIRYSVGAPFAPGNTLRPEGVEFIEYVQTTRSTSGKTKGQWFNTGVVPDYAGRIEVDLASQEENTRTYPVWRTYTRTGGTRSLSMIVIGGEGVRCDLGTNVESGRPAYKGARRTYAYDAGVFSVDGNVIADRSADIASLAALDHELVLGATYDLKNTAASPALPDLVTSTPENCNANFASIRIYRFRYWDAEGNLKRDLRPARDAAGTAALYDMVSDAFIYHTCGGAEAYTPEAYADYATLQGGAAAVCTSAVALEYVETQGNVAGGRQFFDTGFEPSGAAKFEMDVQPLTDKANGNSAFFTDRIAATPAAANKLNLYCLQDKGLRFDVNGVQQQTDYNPGKTRQIVAYNAGVLTIDGAEIADLSASAATLAFSTNRLFLFASNLKNSLLGQTADSNFAKARLFGMKIWDRDGGTLLRAFEPRLDAAGVAGLYDTVNGRFYHSCSNAAVAGPRVGMPTDAQVAAAANVMADAVLNADGAALSARSDFVQQVSTAVACPSAGRTVTADCARFPQAFTWTTADGVTRVTATTGYVPLGAPFASADGTAWTAVLRVRRAAKGVEAGLDTVLSLGTDCGKERVRIGFSGAEASRRLDVRVGRHAWPELGGAVAPAGEWLDVAVVANAEANAVRVALCREGGEPLWWEKTFARDGVRLTNMAARATWRVTLGGVAAADGAEVGRLTADGAWTMFDEPLEAFKGDVQRVALWRRALSDAEILAAFKQVPETGFLMVIR